MNNVVSENGQQLSSSGINMIASKQDTEHDDFLKNHLFSNIDDVFEPLEEKTDIILGTVKGIRQNIHWYYLACSNCKKLAKQKESSTDKVDGSHEVAEIVTYECANPICKNIQISVIPRLTENIDIIDELEKKNHIPQDCFSQTSGNVTPYARDNSTATSPTKLISKATELKRNLATFIDLDEMENL
ncbi:unnamed protein product [Lactuca virosa]|uniref:Replication factor A C-terminal domain-containing protein n=1 Tax=Lactuca virosa TaxID=75947 RepID=A0AAU9MI10_9ASTR|nr:unnamed protein product [Lactuca virosa]